MPNCKTCGYPLGSLNKRKSWTMVGRDGIKTRIELYDCPKCNKTMRVGTRVE